MADLPVPKAEAKPSTSELITDELINRFDNAQTLARVLHARAGLSGWDLVVASTRDALEEVAPILIATGRAQAAADIRAVADRFESVGFPLSPLVLDRAAEIAAGNQSEERA